MSDAELEAFQGAVGELGERVSEFLAENPDCMPGEIEATIEQDGWDAVAENMIDRRETAEKQGGKCLVPSRRP